MKSRKSRRLGKTAWRVLHCCKNPLVHRGIQAGQELWVSSVQSSTRSIFPHKGSQLHTLHTPPQGAWRKRVIAIIYLSQMSLNMSSKLVCEHSSFKRNAGLTSISSACWIWATNAEVKHGGKAASAARGQQGRFPSTRMAQSGLWSNATQLNQHAGRSRRRCTWSAIPDGKEGNFRTCPCLLLARDHLHRGVTEHRSRQDRSLPG